MRTCRYETHDGPCGRAARPYPGGAYCDQHDPATLAGRTVPAPDPALTVAGLRAAALAAEEAAA